ncbi:MAG: helix-turn-helix domain-containing protein [Clostridia bacterium]|nr:helix-turn-helix domain-containing protein [Clostridia bacterium]
MSAFKSKDKNEYVLNSDYEISRVHLVGDVEEHTHKFVELVYTVSGRGVHKIDGKEYHVKSGDMLVINYHCSHSICPSDTLNNVDIMLKPEYVNETLKDTEDIFLLLQLSEFSDLASGIMKDNLLLSFDGEEKQRIELLLSWTFEEQNSKAPAGKLVIRSALSMILSLVFRKMSEQGRTTPAIDDRLLAYIERNCGEKLLVNEIASLCGYSVEHFSRLFKKYTGKLPLEYISECRIKKAKNLLLNTDKPIENIISECGFSNRTAFFKKFYAAEDVTPLQFRKNQK